MKNQEIIQLDEYLEPSEAVKIRTDTTDTTRLQYLITNIAAGALMPVKEYNEHTKKNELVGKYSIWCRLLYIFTNRPEFDEFWAHRSFRMVMQNVVQVSEFLQTAKQNDYKGDELVCAAEYFCTGITQEEHEGTILFSDAIEKLYLMDSRDRNDLEKDEIDDLFFSIQIMIQCQRLSLTMRKNEDQE